MRGKEGRDGEEAGWQEKETTGDPLLQGALVSPGCN